MNESLSLFGYGVRDCPGKAFAMKEIQIVAAYILMNYNIEFSDDDKRNDPQNAEIKVDKSAYFGTEITPEIGLKFSKF